MVQPCGLYLSYISQAHRSCLPLATIWLSMHVDSHQPSNLACLLTGQDGLLDTMFEEQDT